MTRRKIVPRESRAILRVRYSSYAPQGGDKALRAMRACERFGPSGENVGSNHRLRAYVGYTGRCVVGRGRGWSDGVWTSFL
eukprot:scaffold110857_cov72-Phaeocystis_antarctica.AAC.3